MKKLKSNCSNSDESNSLTMPDVAIMACGSSQSLQELEDLLTCAIHIGPLKDPRQLPCSHTFCCQCLEKLLTTHNIRSPTCPLCRLRISDQTQPNQLPKAIIHNQLADLVVKRRKRRISSTSSTESDTMCSKELAHQVCEFVDSSDNIDDDEIDDNGAALMFLFGDEDQLGHSHIPSTTSTEIVDDDGLEEAPTHNLSTCVQLVEPGQYSSACDLGHHERDALRDKMKKQSRYKMYLCLGGIHGLSYYFHSPRELGSIDLDCFHPSVFCRRDSNIINSGAKPNSNNQLMRRLSNATASDFMASSRLLLVNAELGIVIIQDYKNVNGSRVLRLTYPPNNRPIKAMYALFLNNEIIVAGLVSLSSQIEAGVLLKVSIPGDVLQYSELFYPNKDSNVNPLQTTNQNKDCYNVIGNFIFNHVKKYIYLALPGQARVAVLSFEGLIEQDCSYIFTGLHPTFITYKPDSSELWISCPSDQAILVVMEVTGDFRKLSTTFIDKYIVPWQIICTEENTPVGTDVETQTRILLLDYATGSLFWMERWGSSIHVEVQPVTFAGGYRKPRRLRGSVVAVQTVNWGRGGLLISDSKKVCLARPQRRMIPKQMISSSALTKIQTIRDINDRHPSASCYIL